MGSSLQSRVQWEGLQIINGQLQENYLVFTLAQWGAFYEVIELIGAVTAWQFTVNGNYFYLRFDRCFLTILVDIGRWGTLTFSSREFQIFGLSFVWSFWTGWDVHVECHWDTCFLYCVQYLFISNLHFRGVCFVHLNHNVTIN